MLHNRKHCQTGEHCDLANTREAGYCVVRHTIGMSVEQISKASGIPMKRLMRISDRNCEAQAYPQEIAAVTKATGQDAWFQAWAREAGLVVYTVPQVTGAIDAQMFAHARKALRELSEALDEIPASEQDGVICRDDLARIERQFADVHVVCAQIVAYVHERAAKALSRPAPVPRTRTA